MSGGPRGIISAVAADPRRVVFALAALWVLGTAVTTRAVGYGDGGEYHLTAESFVRHASPDLRAGDVTSLAERKRRHPMDMNLPAVLAAYYEDRAGDWYAIHFWGYPLLIAPIRGLLRVLGGDGLRSGQITNALVFLLALHQTLFRAGLTPHVALGAGLLVLFSPAVWFVGWTHTEAFCFAMVVLALAWWRAGRRHAPVLAAALGAMQNPGLLWLVAPLWLRAAWPDAGRLDGRRLLAASAAALPATLPTVFSFWRFGTPSLLARETAAVTYLSAGRAAELLLDLNIGLLPYAPVAVVLFVVSLAASFVDRRWALRAWGVTAVAGFAAWTCTATSTWNHGTAGPSRYVVWLAAFVFYVVAEASAWIAAHAPARVRIAWTAALACAVLSQIFVVFGRGGLTQAEDGERHSYAARLALRHAPAVYNPTPDIFVSRTLGRWARPDEPAVYRDETGCRKAWVRPGDVDLLQQVCGGPPPDRSFFDQQGRDRRKSWRYVDY
jgi:hypothetical protein